MMYGGQVLNEPFPCNPALTKQKCNIMFSIDPSDVPYTKVGTRGYVEVPCKCSLGGANDPIGFCASIIGHDKYATAVSELANVLSSSNCHTLDRNDMRA
jgi:hypothetical protein